MRPTRLWVAMMLALSGGAAWAQEAPSVAQGGGDAAAPARELGAVVVTATPEEEKKKVIGNTSGASKEDIERRNASHMSDLIDQVSGTSVNSLYSRPEVSVGVQGIAGHGRVSHQLEGITQSFQAFTKDLGQTGSIFVEPQFLRSVDVTRGVDSTTGALGSLGSSVDFRYLDLDDILRPGKKIGGMIRGSTGFSKYKNGEKPSGSFFVGGRNESWEVMLGAAESENDVYRVGSNFNNGEMQRDLHANNLHVSLPALKPSFDSCRYSTITGPGHAVQAGLTTCQMTPANVARMKQAAKSGAMPGTEKKTDAQMLRLRHFFNDAYDQSLELFVTANRARFQTDQQPTIKIPANGAQSSWLEMNWNIRAELENEVASLKWKGHFSSLINPEVLLYHEKQERKQQWLGVPGTSGMGQPMHYFVDNGSNGLKLSNASHFDTRLLGPLRLDAGLELRRLDKQVDSLTEEEWYGNDLRARGFDYINAKWDPEARNKTTGFALALSTESDGPWQASAGIGWQRVSMDVDSPTYQVGGVRKAGTQYLRNYYIDLFRAQGDTIPQAVAKATPLAAAQAAEFGGNQSLWVMDDKKHRFNLKSANLALQYTRPGTGLTTYGSVGYSERAPTSNEMYVSGAWMKQGFTANPYLQPEKNLSLQLGVNYQRAAWLMPRDTLDVGFGFYRNRIRNYIGYGPILRENEEITLPQPLGARHGNSYVASVNNLEAVIRQGFELNLAYRQPLFYVRGNLTLPLRHDNKMCSWEAPSGMGYEKTTVGSTLVYTHIGKGQRNCYSGWNWMEASLIEPIRGSLTAALTPMGGKLEVGGTVHYRGKQRAAYYYDPKYQIGSTAKDKSSEPLPDHPDFLTAYLFPKVIKFDVFANYRFNDQFKVGVYVANLSDRMEATPTSHGYNFYPGRTVTANLEYRF